jgi:hypothetical protein
MKIPAAPLVLALLVGAGPAGADDLRGRMGDDAFRAAGLHKLDAAELDALQRWIDGGAGAEPAAPAVVATPAAPGTAAAPADPAASAEPYLSHSPEPAARAVRTRILPPCDGWTGKTVFRMENGEVWQQRHPGRYRHDSDNCEVVIERNLFGGYRMRLLATDKGVAVKRLQ